MTTVSNISIPTPTPTPPLGNVGDITGNNLGLPTNFGAGQFNPQAGITLAQSLGVPIPDASITNDQLVVLLQGLKSKLDENQLQGSSQDVQITKTQKMSAAKERLDQLKEMADKSSKAAKDGVLGKVFGWIAAAAMVIAGAILLATGVGTAAGVALLAGGICMMAVMALQQTGAMDKLMDAMAKGLAPMFEAFGMDKDEAEKAGRIMATCIVGVVIIAAAVAAGIAGGPAMGAMVAASFLPLIFSPENLEKMGVPKDKAVWASFGISIGLALCAAGVGIGTGIASSASKGAQVAAEVGSKAAEGGAKYGGMMGSKIASLSASSAEQLASKLGMEVTTLMKIGSVMGYSAVGVQAAAQVGGGAAAIDGAVAQKAATEASAKAKELQADLLKLQALMQAESDRIDDIIKRLQEGATAVMDVLQQSDKTATKVINI